MASSSAALATSSVVLSLPTPAASDAASRRIRRSELRDGTTRPESVTYSRLASSFNASEEKEDAEAEADGASAAVVSMALSRDIEGENCKRGSHCSNCRAHRSESNDTGGRLFHG